MSERKIEDLVDLTVWRHVDRPTYDQHVGPSLNLWLEGSGGDEYFILRPQVTTWDEYVAFTSTTAVYPKKDGDAYLRLGLASEIGEVAGKLKKRLRDGNVSDEDVLQEIGDCFWYLAQMDVLETIQSASASRTSSKDNVLIDDALIYLSRREYGALAIVLSALVKKNGGTVMGVLQMNVDKLVDRQDRDALKGSGDRR